MSSLTSRAVWFVGLRHICRRCSSSDRDTGTSPVQRHTGSRGPGGLGRSEDRPRRSGLLSWGSSIAPPPTRRSLRPRPPGPSPRLRFGTATSRTCSAPAVPPGFSGLLRSERIRRPTRSTVRGFVAPRSRPWGSPRFGLPGAVSRPCLRPEGRGPEGPSGSRPLWRRPFEAFPSSAAGPCRHRVSSFRTRSRSPTGVPSRRSEPCPLPCRHGALRCLPTSGLSSAEESVAMRATLPLRARSMLPWALDRLVPDAAARVALPSVSAGRFTWRPEPLRCPSTRTSREGRVFRPCLAPATHAGNLPEGKSQRVAVAPASPEGGTSAAIHHA